MFTGCYREIRYAVRGWRKYPLTTAVIILALSLGIGVNVSCFIMVDAIVLRPLPYPQLHRIMTLWESPANQPGDRGPAAPANFFDWKDQNRSFEAIAAFRPWDANLTGSGDPERVQACRVTPEFFQVLGSKPSLGRTFRVEEAEPGSGAVAVVSLGFWKRRLAGNPAALGSSVSLNGTSYTIVGVMPEEFDFPLETEIWAPLALPVAERHDRHSYSLAVLGRLKPGVEPDNARAEMRTLARRLGLKYPESNENRDVQVVPLRELTNNVTDRFVLMLMVTAGFVLLLASANVANLMLVRLANRRRDIAISTAMGATRFRTATLLVGETLVLALVSGGIGLYLADWNLALTHRLIPAEVLRWVAGLKNLRIDGQVVLFTFGASILTALLCVAPSLFHVLSAPAGRDLNEALKDTGRGASAGRRYSRLRSILAISEVALALILLVGAGVMVRTFQALATTSPGFDPRNLLSFQIALPPSNYGSEQQYAAFYERLLPGLAGVPGAKAAAARATIGDADEVFIEGHATPRPGESMPTVYSVTGRYFETLRLPILEGRAIHDADDAGYQRVLVVSSVIAQHYWPGASPVGSRVRLSRSDPRWFTVIGVCGDVKDWFDNRPIRRVYVSFRQSPRSDATVLLRTAGDPLGAANLARAEVWKVDRSQPVFALKSMEQAMAEETSGVRAAAISMVRYALIALFLAASGIYAVISYSVAQRTHEIGIRMALGARPGDVLAMALADAARLGAAGLAIGIPVALGLMRAMSSALYGVIRIDALTFIGTAATLAVCAGAAGYVPAVRAARLDPLAALRTE